METYTGKAVFKGIAIGTISFYKKTVADASRHEVQDGASEIARFQKARDIAIGQLNSIYKKAVDEIGEETAAIFDVQSMMLADDDFNDSVYEMIRDRHDNAEYAVSETGKKISQMFAEMDDEYMQARSFDILDVSGRLLNVLCGTAGTVFSSDDPFILVAEDLTPAETIQLDKTKLLAFVTKNGSSNSHTAILARTMNIPAIVGVSIEDGWNGKNAIVDGFTGTLIIEPDTDTLKVMKQKQETEQARQAQLTRLKGLPDVTKNGYQVKLYANIGNPGDVSAVLENDAQGIGLFRSEFLYIGRTTYPSEDVQFGAYKNVVRKMDGKKVIIRTLDIGADKKADYFHLAPEENPAMGFRAIRICLSRPDLFKTQLRAIYRASAFGSLAIMYPMIISVDEVRRIKKITAEVRQQLTEEHIPFTDVEQGIMIETPAAVMMSEELAREVDFFSIGTNDLTQYTLAIDRQNETLDAIFDPHHPAILKMIRMTIENGHKHNCWVGICGELGADTELTESFIKMGIDELSVSPARVLEVRQRIRELSV